VADADAVGGIARREPNMSTSQIAFSAYEDPQFAMSTFVMVCRAFNRIGERAGVQSFDRQVI